jgi:putative FmdB family regulatory protein
MFIFDVYCESCDDTEEVWLKSGDKNPPKCDKCGSARKKLIGSKSFELKYNPKTDICSWGSENYATTQRYRYANKKSVKE